MNAAPARRGLRRALLLALAAIVVLFLLAAVLVPLLVDADAFRPAVESRLSALLGRPVTLESLSLSLWTGPRLTSERLVIGESPELPAGTTSTLEASSVAIRPALLPLLRGDVELRGIAAHEARIVRAGRPLLERARLRATVRRARSGTVVFSGRVRGALAAVPGAPASALAFEGSFESGALVLDDLDIDIGPAHFDLAVRGSGFRTASPQWALDGEIDAGGTKGRAAITSRAGDGATRLSLDLDLERVDFNEIATVAGWATSAGAAAPAPPGPGRPRAEEPSVLETLVATGRIRARSARFAGLDLQGFTTRLGLDGGVVRFDDAAFGFYGGRHAGDLTLDVLAEGVPFSLRSDVRGVDVARLATAFSGDGAGALRGSASLGLDLRGVAYAPSVLRTVGGGMRLSIANGSLASVGLLRQVAMALEAAGGRGIGREQTPFRSLSGTFGIVAGVARTGDLTLDSDDLDLTASGSVDLEGPLDMRAVAAFSPDASSAMVARTSALRYRVAEDGRLTVPLRVRGTLAAPQVQVDVRTIVQEGIEREVRRKVEQRAKEKLRNRADDLLRDLLE